MNNQTKCRICHSILSDEQISRYSCVDYEGNKYFACSIRHDNMNQIYILSNPSEQIEIERRNEEERFKLSLKVK